MRRGVCFALLAFLAAAAGSASAAERGTGLAFLRIGVGAEAAGFGNAVVSRVDDGTATFWNPAGIARVPTLDATFMHNEYFQDLRYEFLGVARRIGDNGIGASIADLHTASDALERRDDVGNFEGHFGSYDLAVALGYGRRVHEDLTAGVTVKYLTENIDRTNANGYAFDFGAQWDSPVERLRLGAAVLNLGPSMTFINDAFDLPTTVQGGASYSIPLVEGAVDLAAEFRKARGESAGLNFGMGYEYHRMASVRLGYRSGLDSEDVSFGLGFRHERFGIDYAFVPYGNDLGDTHRIGLSYRY
jgi:hypothetical protein